MKDKLSSFLNPIKGVSYKPSELKDNYDNESFYLLRSNNIKNNSVNFNDVQIVNSDAVNISQKLIPKDIVVCMSNGSKNLVGKNAQFKVPINNYCVGAFCGGFRAKDISKSDYLFQLFQSDEYRNYLDVTLAGSAINNLKSSDILKFEFYFPEPAHQKKIANILNTIDSIIEKTVKSISKYQAIKKGMMYDLFTRGIELKTGKLRPKYENAPELYKESELGMIPKDWKTEYLGSLIKGKGVYGVNAAAVNYKSNLYTYLRITDISEDGYFKLEGKKSVNHPEAKNFLLEKGDIVFARTGNSTGKTYLYNEDDGILVFAGFLIRFKPNENLLDATFLKFYTETQQYWNWVSIYSMRTGQPGINENEYGKLLLPKPSLEEQKIISEKLMSINNKIQSENKSLKKHLQIKKGLMQDLLTGKVEVTV